MIKNEYGELLSLQKTFELGSSYDIHTENDYLGEMGLSLINNSESAIAEIILFMLKKKNIVSELNFQFQSIKKIPIDVLEILSPDAARIASNLKLDIFFGT
jgi:hypothetical protein